VSPLAKRQLSSPKTLAENVRRLTYILEFAFSNFDSVGSSS
jgi:hypothetical protein